MAPAELSDRLQAVLGAAYRVEKEVGGGGIVRTRLAREGALPVRDAIRILKDVADALGYVVAAMRAFHTLARGDTVEALRLFDARPDTASAPSSASGAAEPPGSPSSHAASR